MNNRVALVKGKGCQYSSNKNFFRPDRDYPEYIFHSDISLERNEVYEMVRNGLYLLGLDKENYGTRYWNPLQEYVRPGNRVLLKPNMVMDINPNGEGTDCLYTNPSIVAAILDYVLIALKGKGQVIIGDAPLQECQFDILLEKSGYLKLVEFYQSKGIKIEIIDFRNVKTYDKKGIRYLQANIEDSHGLIVKLDKESAFSCYEKKQLGKLRITNYDPRILQEHHSEHRHEYMIAREVLEADAIINIPKIKTHRKAGITAALKNLVGINANKEYLPHHQVGSEEEGGDAYQYKNLWYDMANKVLDIKNIFNSKKEYEKEKIAFDFYNLLYNEGRSCCKYMDNYWEGSWYGNQTIWRTILDLNKILLYGKMDGTISNKIVRKMFIVGDMIIAGEKEGPLVPSPVSAGVLVLGSDALAFDRTVCALMGYDEKNIPCLQLKNMNIGDLKISTNEDPDVYSNHASWNKKSIFEIRNKAAIHFIPTSGWECVLGNYIKDELLDEAVSFGEPIYLWGAGEYGTNMASYIQYRYKKKINSGISIFDSDSDKWGKEIVHGIRCEKPVNVSTGVCIITVGEQYRDQIMKSAKKIGFKHILVV